MLHRIALLICSSLVADAAFALATVSLEIRDELPALSSRDSRPVEFQDSIAIGPATAYGYANLDTGVLRASAAAPTGSGKYSFAEARIEDTLTFDSGAAGTAHLDWSFDGNLSPYAGDAQSMAGLTVAINGAQRTYIITNASCMPISATACTEGTSIARTGSYSFDIGQMGTSILVALVAYPGSGGDADFSNTGRVFLRTPAGVGFTSGSGTFLANASPIPAIPEPNSHALMWAGVIAVMALWRRKHMR